MRRIVGLGLCVVDHSYRVESLEPQQVRTRYRERHVSSGGMTATALRQAAALGCDAHLLSIVGDDAEGRYLRRTLRAAGVKTRRLIASAHAPTTLAVVLVEPSGERRFLVPDRRRSEARAPELDLSVIRRDGLLLVDGHFPAQALRAARRARALGGTVVGDFHRPAPGVRRLLPHVDHAIVPMEFVQAAGHGDPRRTLRELAAVSGGRPVVTQGPRGGLYLDGNRVRRFAAQRTRVVDSTGAGDVFHGAFAAGLAYGLDFEVCLRLAARAAAYNCSALGGAGRFMTRAEMRRVLAVS